MFKKFGAALLAVTMLSAPVLAQSTMMTTRAPVTQPAKHVAVKATKTTMKTHKPIFAKAHKTSKVTKAKIHKAKVHKVKKHKIVKHTKPVVFGKHNKPATSRHN